ncbi:hypothetical protein MA16_Dca020346 [Dendrobium catenatum]|uniref:Uncharacterized protein n=1 Tax=Dendrobium catenatum TaxID=906689 RepID=A0A2I0VMU0_9ASPA|nr:hypothetical protein MA16_Dca020346 [Dendrobium catenatum]
MTASRSFIPAKSLRTDDDDEDISDDQISSTSPSVEFGFEEFEDPLPNSLFLPLYDEPVYDVYDDDMLDGVLDIDQPAYDDDEGKIEGQLKPNVQQELFIPNVTNKTSIAPAIVDKKIASEDLLNGLDREALIFSSRWLKEPPLVIYAFTITRIPYAYASLERLKIGRQIDTGWTYPNWFSQPNPPPYGGQPDICL